MWFMPNHFVYRTRCHSFEIDADCCSTDVAVRHKTFARLNFYCLIESVHALYSHPTLRSSAHEVCEKCYTLCSPAKMDEKNKQREVGMAYFSAFS